MSADLVARQIYWHQDSLPAVVSIVGPLVEWVVGVDESQRNCRMSRISLANQAAVNLFEFCRLKYLRDGCHCR